jgi:hypothetical protein
VIGAQPAFPVREGWYPVVARDRQHIAQAQLGDPGAEGAVASGHRGIIGRRHNPA